ncbi:uncharacterized protein C2orf78-like [Rhynchocyon petersi]
MSENIQNPSLRGTPEALQLSLPVQSNAAPLPGSVCNFSMASAQLVSSTWLLPSASVTPLQPLTGNAHTYQHPSTMVLSAFSAQSLISTSSVSHPGIAVSGNTGQTENVSSALSEGASKVTLIHQGTAISAMCMATHYPQIPDTNSMVPLYPALSAHLVQGAANQGHGFSHSYQEGSQVYYYNPGTMGPLLSGRLVPRQQSHGSMSHATEGVASVPQPEMVTVLREAQPSNVLALDSTSGIHYSISAQSTTDSRFHAPTQEQREGKIAEEIKGELPTSLDAYQIPGENQDAPLILAEIPDRHQLLALTDPLTQEEPSPSGSMEVAKNTLCLEDQETLENNTESCNDFAEITKPVETMHAPQLFMSLEDLDQPKGPETSKAIDAKVIKATQMQENSSLVKPSSHHVRRNKRKASEPIPGGPEAKIQAKTTVGEMFACKPEDSDRTTEKIANHSKNKHHKAASSKTRKKKSPGQEKTKRTREKKVKPVDDSEQPANQDKAEGKPITASRKRRRSEPEPGRETFQKPRSSLGRYPMGSVQVFHALGKKSDQGIGPSCSRALGKSSNTKQHQAPPAIKPRIHLPPAGKGAEKTHVKAQKPGSSAESHPSPSQEELPPPGKLKLIPLPFLTRPEVRRVPRVRPTRPSHHPSGNYPPGPASTNSALPVRVTAPQPAPVSASGMGPARPARPSPNNPAGPPVTQPTGARVLKPAASKPAAHTTAPATALQPEPAATVESTLQPRPQPQTAYLLEDFSRQPIPWRKADILGPAESTPITEEQRPEREAMKRKAQQEREEAAQYSSLGRLQFFVQRERDMDISQGIKWPLGSARTQNLQAELFRDCVGAGFPTCTNPPGRVLPGLHTSASGIANAQTQQEKCFRDCLGASGSPTCTDPPGRALPGLHTGTDAPGKVLPGLQTRRRTRKSASGTAWTLDSPRAQTHQEVFFRDCVGAGFPTCTDPPGSILPGLHGRWIPPAQTHQAEFFRDCTRAQRHQEECFRDFVGAGFPTCTDPPSSILPGLRGRWIPPAQTHQA